MPDPDIMNMDKEGILSLSPEDITRTLKGKEILHIFEQLGGLWRYNRKAAKEERKPGYHALLKSGYHSDGFLNSKEVLKHENICYLLAKQLFQDWKELDLPLPSKVAGIPTGATPLGEHLASLLGAEVLPMDKIEGKIKIKGDLNPMETLLLIEDFCTKGTGFKEAVADIKTRFPETEILPFEPVIINRGGMREIRTEHGTFKILPLAQHRINDWAEDICPLCLMYDSTPIKPKENWELLVNSQK